MVKVKICCVTNLDDALLVTNIGADYIGFNFYKESLRKISEKLCKEVVAKLPPFIIPVGVFVDEDINLIAKTAKKCSLKMIQLHGSETPEYCKEAKSLTNLGVIKAGKPFFLAGGITPDNVSEAITKVQPFAVDVATGVERLPRRKDYDKVNKLVRIARGLKA
ncbi:MAG: phosphoribosylanthranilate isomerase [Elusimicrobia bacterium]|nr:phosphoribosylanthranilate isomerase [Elusimicrobiota bacterium]